MRLLKPKSFTISRRGWKRGSGGLATMLLDGQTRLKCCLGFYALACGVKELDIEDKSLPDSLYCANEGYLRLPGMLRVFDGDRLEHTKTCSSLIDINDARNVRDREGKIRALFAKIGVKVRFTA